MLAFLVVGFAWFAAVVLHDHQALHYFVYREVYERIFTAALRRNPGAWGWARVDAAVIEFAARLPVAERVRGITTKVFLKRYAARYLPRAVVNRRKRGLSVPLGAWLRGPLRGWARACLARDVLQEIGVDNVAALRLLATHCARERDHARAIWTLIVLSEWLEWKARACSSALACRTQDALPLGARVGRGTVAAR